MKTTDDNELKPFVDAFVAELKEVVQRAIAQHFTGLIEPPDLVVGKVNCTLQGITRQLIANGFVEASFRMVVRHPFGDYLKGTTDNLSNARSDPGSLTLDDPGVEMSLNFYAIAEYMRQPDRDSLAYLLASAILPTPCES